MKIMKICLGVIGFLIFIFVSGLYGLGWHKFFEPEKESIRREVFEQTQSYVKGKIQDLAKYHDEIDTAGCSNAGYTINGLTANVQRSFAARNRDSATPPDTTSYSDFSAIFTLANTPSAPTVSAATESTLTLNINVSGNPAHTEFAIRDSTRGKYINSEGDTSSTATWQTNAQWGAVVVTGLDEGEDYVFCVKARYVDYIETAYSAPDTGTVLPKIVRVKGDSTLLAKYGLQYPVTRVFTIPSWASACTVKHCHTNQYDWQTVLERDTSDFFNGIECARFDYEHDSVYVSLKYDANSDYIYIKCIDNNGNEIDFDYVHCPEYYDNRVCAVTSSHDQWGPQSWTTWAAFDATCSLFCALKMPMTWCSITEDPILNWPDCDWDDNMPTLGDSVWDVFQAWIDSSDSSSPGFIFPASHGQGHAGEICLRNQTPEGIGFGKEIGDSQQDLIDLLDCPYSRGMTEFMPAWVSGYGEVCTEFLDTLGVYNYLTYVAGSMSTTPDQQGEWATWNETYDMFENKNGVYHFLESKKDTCKVWKDSFDVYYNNGDIFHIRSHPMGKMGYWVSATGVPADSIVCALEYIAGRKDVWYVDNAGLYLYHIEDLMDAFVIMEIKEEIAPVVID